MPCPGRRAIGGGPLAIDANVMSARSAEIARRLWFFKRRLSIRRGQGGFRPEEIKDGRSVGNRRSRCASRSAKGERDQHFGAARHDGRLRCAAGGAAGQRLPGRRCAGDASSTHAGCCRRTHGARVRWRCEAGRWKRRWIPRGLAGELAAEAKGDRRAGCSGREDRDLATAHPSGTKGSIRCSRYRSGRSWGDGSVAAATASSFPSRRVGRWSPKRSRWRRLPGGGGPSRRPRRAT